MVLQRPSQTGKGRFMPSTGTLLLDQSFYPIQFIDWKKAMTLFLTERAEVIEHHADVDIRSAKQSFKLPKVLRLFVTFKQKMHIRFSRHNIFYRDNGQCQYCGVAMRQGEFTLDHVLPSSRGGKTTWDNVVACCSKCNCKKGDKTPKEAGMKLAKKPVPLKWTPALAFKLGKRELDQWSEWLGWMYKKN